MEQDHGLLRVNPVGSLGPGDRLLVLLHGFGADENDLAPLVQHIDPDGRLSTQCARPEAFYVRKWSSSVFLKGAQ